MNLAGKTILVVEDEELIRICATEALASLGMFVAEAANADEAIALLDVGTDFATVFTDIQMPGSMDGVALAHAVRQRWPDMTIVVTSGKVRCTEIELPADAHFLAKPYLIDQLVTILDGDCEPSHKCAQPIPAWPPSEVRTPVRFNKC